MFQNDKEKMFFKKDYEQDKVAQAYNSNTRGGLRQKHCEFQSSLGYKSKIKSPKKKSYFTERLR